MNHDEKTYNVGDKIWYATFESIGEKVPCPVCFGNKKVIVILGNGDEIGVGCQYCEKGFEGSLGYVIEYIKIPRAEQFTITRRRVEEEFGKEKFEYSSNGRCLYAQFMFESQEEATSYANEMEELKEDKPKYKNEKSYTWNAGYHLKQAESKRREVTYHEERAKLCKERSKEKINESR